MKRRPLSHAALLALCLALLLAALGAHAENPVVYLNGWQATDDESPYFGSWAFERAVNDAGAFDINGISAETYTLTIGPGWYSEIIGGQASLYPTVHLDGMLMCLFDDGSGAPAYFRLFLSEDDRLFTPMGSGSGAFTVYFSRVDDVPGGDRGAESDDAAVGDWVTGDADGLQGRLTIQANGLIRLESADRHAVGMWSREDGGIDAAWTDYTTTRFAERDGALEADDGILYARAED